MNRKILGALLASTTFTSFADNGISAQVLLGSATQATRISTAEINPLSNNDVSIGIRAAYTLNKNISFEALYQNYGVADSSLVDASNDNIRHKINSSAFNFGVKGVIPFDYGLSLNGRFGISFWDAKIQTTDSAAPGEVFKSDDTGSDIYYGLGIDYRMSQNVRLGIEYIITDMNATWYSVDVENKVKNLSFSIGYYF
ncbi:MAG: porin family protein [Gammaproteobacteria bacterium]|nr:porin family protein [Gammaproteobacteria bacterium]